MRICERLANDGQSPRVTVSVGVSVYPTDGITIEKLFGAADKALYRMKAARRKAIPPGQRGRLLVEAIPQIAAQTEILLNKSHIGLGARSRPFRQRSKLRLVSRYVLLKRAHQPFCMRRAHNHAGHQLPLRYGGKQIDEIQREFLGVVVHDHQIGILAEQFFFVGLDLHLLLLWIRLVQPFVFSLNFRSPTIAERTVSPIAFRKLCRISAIDATSC